ncbi:MAG: RdgB/HAM1 family non-canonical purine NTP pyrophosphatase [Caldilinea sp.]
MSRTTLLVATHNVGKAREYMQLLADLPVVITWLDQVGIRESVDETGATFTENALLKARYYAEVSKLLTWADDSGLEVDALGGRPGVLSARYGGKNVTDRERCMALLHELEDVPDEARTARFRCVIAIATPDGQAWTAEGAVEGLILRAPRGDNGFGYDPIFLTSQYQKSMAELPPEIKNQVSHRAMAAREARLLLARLLV